MSKRFDRGVGTGVFNFLVLFKVIGKPAPIGFLKMVKTVNLYILISSFDSFTIDK